MTDIHSAPDASALPSVAVIGAGNVGRSLARGMRRAGATVVLGVRDPATFGLPAALQGVDVATPAAAAARADVAVLAIPVDALAELVPTLAMGDGTVLVDATNAVGRPIPGGHATVAEHVAALAPGAAVVKAFNTVGAEHLAGDPVDGAPVFLPVAGDDAGRPAVVALAEAMGFQVADLGGPEAVALVEAHAQLWIRLAFARGWGRAWALTTVGR